MFVCLFLNESVSLHALAQRNAQEEFAAQKVKQYNTELANMEPRSLLSKASIPQWCGGYRFFRAKIIRHHGFGG